MKKWIAALALFTLLAPICARAEEYDDAQIYAIHDTEGTYLTSRAGRVYAGDEYIAGDNRLYRVLETDEDALRATAEYIGYEPQNAAAAFQLMQSARAEAQKLVCMYSTHSDESYEPSDGTSSKTRDAGIYDVGNALKENLEAKGITVEYSEDTFLPHDAGAYRRSRATAEELLKSAPAALLDLHRDGIPDPAEYEHELDGEQVSKVRLLVGRSNANADANRAFAKQIKATADQQYPGLVKDIYIGKGNYNQELYPKALLLEFGTHTTSKQEAMKSSAYVADVLDEVLFRGSAAPDAPAAKQQAGAGGKGVLWLVGIAAIAALVYILASTGSLRAIGSKLSRSASEITGGLLGKKPRDKDGE